MISVHIITGFLGVGKTTLVKNLISQKPKDESWAIIVNEFGELGVDALLLQDSDVTIKQVPGGCACCAANLPFQVSLNQLLKSQSFDRIFIEPSGLGHGDKLAQLLEEDQYKDWLTLDGVITLVDPKQFNQSKYREHGIYIRQLQVADAVVISKSDLATTDEVSEVQDWALSSKLPVFVSNQGALALDFLSTIHRKPAMMFFRPVVKGDSGYYTQGIQFAEDAVFNHEPLISYLQDSKWERIKGVIKTTQGWYRINYADEAMDVSEFIPQDMSTLEIIHDKPLAESLEFELKALVIK